MNEMNRKRVEYVFSAVVIAAFLILTAWGNATAMLVVSAIGLIVGILLFRGRTRRRGLLAAALGVAVAAAIPIVISLSRGH